MAIVMKQVFKSENSQNGKKDIVLKKRALTFL